MIMNTEHFLSNMAEVIINCKRCQWKWRQTDGQAVKWKEKVTDQRTDTEADIKYESEVTNCTKP